jgi:hypothetical protein
MLIQADTIIGASPNARPGRMRRTIHATINFGKLSEETARQREHRLALRTGGVVLNITMTGINTEFHAIFPNSEVLGKA